MNKRVKNVLRSFKQSKISRDYQALYKKILEIHPEYSAYVEGEEEWLKHWQKYDKKLQPTAFRIFSHYCGNDINIVPLETFAAYFEHIITPGPYCKFYNDKNSLPLIVNKAYLPHTFLRNIGGRFFNDNYDIITDVELLLSEIPNERLILKPSGEGSGRGIELLMKKQGEYYTTNGEKLSLAWLNTKYASDYLIQECIVQDSSLSRFNSSSVNTIRMAVYRDTKGVWQCTAAILRIGGIGAFVDNAHAGGVYVGIDIESGKIGDWVCNWLGVKNEVYNDVVFPGNTFYIPNWEKVLDFSKMVCHNVIHHDLVALDICITENSELKLLEMNIGGFGAWPFPFTGHTTFGKYTNDVVNSIYDNSSMQYQFNNPNRGGMCLIFSKL